MRPVILQGHTPIWRANDSLEGALMDGAALLLRPLGLEIERIAAEATVLSVSVISRLATSLCPLGDAHASRIHSRYHRTVADVAGGGRQVRLPLSVRKFF